MEHQDLIKNQIEKLGKVLGKILADFLGFKSSGQIESGIEVTSKQFKSELDIDIDDLVVFSKDELNNYLVDRKFTTGHFERLGKYLIEIGESSLANDKNKAKNYLTQSLVVLELEDEFSKTMSFERLNLKAKINKMLQQ